MKVIKANEVPTSENSNAPATAPKIDKKKVAELTEKFDLLQNQLNSKEYAVLLNAEQTTHLFESVYPNFQWKGYESYAISETYDTLKSQVNKKGNLDGKVKVEIIEALFHFLKNHVSTGVDGARFFRQICDQFAISMTEINTDRQNLKDLSLELVATEQGISVEKLVEGLQKQNPSFQG